MRQTYAELKAWMDGKGLVPASGPREYYLSDPAVETDPSTWRTQIVWPIT